MKALVLAAGLGERLRPITDEVPKPLLEIGGRPLIHYPLLMLRDAGVYDVAINVHHLAAKIEAALGTGESLAISITYSPEPVLLGTGGPLLALRSYFAGQPFLILNGDTIMDLDLSVMIAQHRERAAMVTMAVCQTDSPEAYSQIEIDHIGQIRRMRLLISRAQRNFTDYPSRLTGGQSIQLRPMMYCGAMVCEPTILDLLPASSPFSLIENVFAPMVTQGLPLFGYVHNGFFRTIDDLESYHSLRSEFATSSPSLPYLARSSTW